MTVTTTREKHASFDTLLERYESPMPFIITEIRGSPSKETVFHFLSWVIAQPEWEILFISPTNALELMFPSEPILSLNTMYLQWLSGRSINER